MNLKSKFWLELRKHHLVHLFGDSHHGFGVSSKFWDLVIRTTFKRSADVKDIPDLKGE